MYKLSIIVPVYNTAEYLDQCINSILSQTITDYEIILVDDESPDNAGKMCDQYADEHKNIKVIHKKNGGLGYARNSGLEIAEGEYVAFLDSDDYVSQDYYKSLLTISENNNLDICMSKGYYKFNDDYEEEFIYQNEYLIIENDEVKEAIPKLISKKVSASDGLWGSSCFSLYRKSIFTDGNIKFISERDFISEDLWFSMDAFSKAQKVGLVDVIGYHYRYNPASLSRKYNRNRFLSLTQSIVMLEEKCSMMKLVDFEERVALYYYGVFEKCINQEVRFVGGKQGYKNMIEMAKEEHAQKYLGLLSKNRGYKGTHALLCRMIYHKLYWLAWCLLKIYNRIEHKSN